MVNQTRYEHHYTVNGVVVFFRV